jgi:beta-galactosidase
VATKELSTAGKAEKMELEADRKTIKADGKDLSFIKIKITDAKGNLVPNAANQLSFKVSGAGAFRAVCNGDPTSLEPFHLPTMKTFNGMLVVVVQANENPGKISVEITTPGLKKGAMELRAE